MSKFKVGDKVKLDLNIKLMSLCNNPFLTHEMFKILEENVQEIVVGDYINENIFEAKGWHWHEDWFTLKERPISLKEKELNFLHCLPSGVNYLAKDNNEDLWGFSKKPIFLESFGSWDTSESSDELYDLTAFSHLFDFMILSEEPYLVSDLIKGVVTNH